MIGQTKMPFLKNDIKWLVVENCLSLEADRTRFSYQTFYVIEIHLWN